MKEIHRELLRKNTECENIFPIRKKSTVENAFNNQVNKMFLPVAISQPLSPQCLLKWSMYRVFVRGSVESYSCVQ